MKASAIVRICVWTLVTALLIGVLTFGLVFDSFDFSLSFGSGGYHFDEDGSYQIGDTCIASPFEITALDIEWVAGSVRVLSSSETDEIIIREGDVEDTRDALRWRIHNGELQIRYCKPRFFGTDTISKDLEIILPVSMFSLENKLDRVHLENVSSHIFMEGFFAHELDIESVSGEISVKQCDLDHLDLESVSGRINVADCEIEKMETSTVSGNVNVTGVVRNVDINGVSAKLELHSVECPKNVSVETVSGSVDLYIPENSGFIIDVDAMSGSISAPDFLLTALGNGRYSCGNGNARFELESMSGHMNIWKISRDE